MQRPRKATSKDHTSARGGDPHAEHASYHDLDSRISVLGHPIHAMLVAFPIAGCFAIAFCDGAWWWTGDYFWARAGLWASGGAFAMGCVAALSGLAELLLVPGVRQRAAAWSHAVAAMALIAVIGANWYQRIADPAAAILPWGMLLSALSVLMVAIAGWHGGKLVFEHQVGVKTDDDDIDREEKAEEARAAASS